MFAQLLPDAGRTETTRQDTTRGVRQAERAKESGPSENRQANQTRPAEPQQSDGGPKSDSLERETDTSTEATAQQVDGTPNPDATAAAGGLVADAVPPADAPALSAEAKVAVETDAGELLSKDGLTSPAPASGTPASTSPATPDGEAAATGASSAAPPATTAPASQPVTPETPAEQPTPDLREAGKSTQKTEADGAPESETQPEAKPTADTPTRHAEVSGDRPGVISGKPTADVPPTPKPGDEDREPGNPTIDAPKIAEPAPDEPNLGKPGVAAGPEAGQGDATEPPGEPIELPKDVPHLPRDNLVPPAKVTPMIGASKAIDGTADATVPDGEAGEQPAGEDLAKTRKPLAAREEAETGPAKKQPSHAEFRPLIIDPAGSEFRVSDIRLGHALDLPTTTSVPSAQGAHATAATALAQAQTQAAASPPVPLDGIAVVISNNAQGGRNRFEIRLDPPELGRIDVRLHIDSKGHVTSHLIVDRPETLDLLRRDAADLERSLQQSGLKTSDNGLQFSLRDQSANTDRNDQGREAAYAVAPETELPTPAIVMRGYTRAGEGGGLDIRV